jgi:lipoate synthase
MSCQNAKIRLRRSNLCLDRCSETPERWTQLPISVKLITILRWAESYSETWAFLVAFHFNWIETVPRLFPQVRPQGQYLRSIRLLDVASHAGTVTKSGLMVGLGEQKEELSGVMNELRAAGCSILSIGQYLQPTKNHWPVIRFYEPQEFDLLKQEGVALGFRHVEAGPLVRSSYHAAEQTVTPSPVTPPLS